MTEPTLTHVHYRREDRILDLTFSDGHHYALSAEYLRVHSPSAEVKGHGAGQEVLQVGKKNVGLTDITPAGHYALKLHFDDDHDSGLYTFEYLLELALHEEQYWARYLERLEKAGQTRQPMSISIKQL
ncbi:gamma-butyrobetaine hydroxylase-like domain-containing protein [Larsenimonas suaedae]|uniref:DUF971 domain-containing protein n=1 Tax=Larsenimonas suaedae TaxID=1851019 RepID=A0ABU1GSC1_9GAMM|nr:DUF971 domain-containing protein [Larsenimonas suaedae]MCM2972289.1 DUF971 domain-containing protein [Larsenimonas suaedae]MDR5894915.1 DUF971 domain-containing protein [Larsenimonas suaedae]